MRLLLSVVIRSQTVEGITCYKSTESGRIEEKSEKGTACIMYHNYGMLGCRKSETYYDIWKSHLMTLPICGVFVNHPTYLAACLCNEDSCNTPEKMQSVLDQSLVESKVLQNMKSYEPFYEWEAAIADLITKSDPNNEYLQCMKKNLYGEGGISKTTIIIIVIVVVFVCGIAFVAVIKIRANYHKQQLALTWEQRVKEVGKELEKQGAPGAGESKPK
ncbi:unnamed protein product [Cylicocyclus nassatus]|uniref:Uncharacterized protein n=1 Tax=Cylicocyclus nassatus TaxID=53992 RepID=A0AA36MCF1_CYLNA|nr:unnamed protein product [Cylicocyclus nassatus]